MLWDYKKRADKVCTVCLETFTPQSNNQKVCSKKCVNEKQKLYHRERNNSVPLAKKRCSQCRKTFMQLNSGQKTCSRECSKILTSKRAKARRKENPHKHTDSIIRRDIPWNMDFDPWDTIKSGCYGFVRDAEMCPLG